MSAHTPGPWTLDPCASGWMLISNGQDITAEPLDARDADARLIAAAPALLEALQNCANVLALALPLFDDESTDSKDSRDEVESVIDAARAAIERATGGAP